jgi:hypothetical protein
MKTITAKFNSRCAETGYPIKKGDKIVYCYQTRKAYCLQSPIAKDFLYKESIDPAAGMIQANEDAYFDNFCQMNGI